MQVFSSSNGAIRPMNAQQRPQAAVPGSVRPPIAKPAEQPIVRRDQIDISGQGLDGPSTEMTPRERLDAYAERFLDRLDNLISKEGLSEAQVTALQEAKAEFQKNIERFDDAFLEGSRSRDGIGPALKNIITALRESVHAALREPSARDQA